jgi:methionyl-tRNA formyltransferase
VPIDTLSVAWANGVPVLAVSDLHHPQKATTLAGLEADVACVSCFPWRIPPDILRLPRLGFLNLHPSLLPAYRGPSPLFWQLRDGAPAGVTIHTMDEAFDAGPIAAQQAVELPDGSSGPEAERLLTGAGIDLLRGVLDDLTRGIVRQWPQPAGGSYQGRPQDVDFALSTEWAARRAFNFMRGTADWGRPYAVSVAGESLRLVEAYAYNELELGRPSVRQGRNILIRFNPGILYARLSG